MPINALDDLLLPKRPQHSRNDAIDAVEYGNVCSGLYHLIGKVQSSLIEHTEEQKEAHRWNVPRQWHTNVKLGTHYVTT